MNNPVPAAVSKMTRHINSQIDRAQHAIQALEVGKTAQFLSPAAKVAAQDLIQAIPAMESALSRWLNAMSRMLELELAEIWNRESEAAYVEQYKGQPASTLYAYGSQEFERHFGKLRRLASDRQVVLDEMAFVDRKRRKDLAAIMQQYTVVDGLIEQVDRG